MRRRAAGRHGGAPHPRRPRLSAAFVFLRQWGISLASLVLGILTLFVFRRGVPHVGWFVGYLLLLWLLIALIEGTREPLATSSRRSHRAILFSVEYTIQTLYHGLLLFMLPAYWASTTLTSRNAVFLGLLAAAAVLATFDPWYRALVDPRPWARYAFFLVTVFSALNLALPLVQVPPAGAVVASATLAVLALTPAIRRAGRWPWARALLVSMSLAAAVGLLAAAGRAWIPPTPLFLAHAALAWNEGAVESLEPKPEAIAVADLRRRGLVAYTAIYAPAGLRQPVRHVWRRDGHVVNVVDLAPVYGGRREGFRTFSRKTGFPADPIGRWSVDVVTSAGQLVGRLGFRVVP